MQFKQKGNQADFLGKQLFLLYGIQWYWKEVTLIIVSSRGLVSI